MMIHKREFVFNTLNTCVWRTSQFNPTVSVKLYRGYARDNNFFFCATQQYYRQQMTKI